MPLAGSGAAKPDRTIFGIGIFTARFSDHCCFRPRSCMTHLKKTSRIPGCLHELLPAKSEISAEPTVTAGEMQYPIASLGNASCPSTKALCSGIREASTTSTSFTTMSMLSALGTSLLAGLLGQGVLADNAATTTSLTAPPPGQTPSGDYSGQYRPQLHFSPPVVSAAP